MDLLMKSGPKFKAPKSRLLGIGMVLTLLTVTTTACLETSPTDSVPSSPVLTDPPDSTIEFRDPSVPVINPGMGLPDSESGSLGTDEEVDCDDAEDLCDSGAWACDDIADYCDIGPDDGSELPEDWDWDQ
jgi:hypothetical protein